MGQYQIIYSTQVEAKAQAMRATGATYREISETLGMSITSAFKLANGLPRGVGGKSTSRGRTSPYPTEVAKKARELREQGWTEVEIGKQLGISNSTAWKMYSGLSPYELNR